MQASILMTLCVDVKPTFRLPGQEIRIGTMPRRKNSEFKRYASQFARRGGEARAKKLDSKRRSEIAKKAARARWEKARKT